MRSAIAIFLAALASTSAWADAWDDAGDASAATSVNVLWHTAPAQRHDLAAVGGVADQDWFRIFPRAGRSYEVQLVNSTIDSGALTIQRTTSAGGLIESSLPLDAAGNGRTFRWHAPVNAEERIRVEGSNSLSATAQYDILLRETTLYCPRWNHAATQVTVVIVQRANTDLGPGACEASVYFYDENANLLAVSSPQSLPPNKVTVMPTAAIPALIGQKGAAHVAHTCGVGGIKAKMVALEPATGFSFDTPCSERER